MYHKKSMSNYNSLIFFISISKKFNTLNVRKLVNIYIFLTFYISKPIGITNVNMLTTP